MILPHPGFFIQKSAILTVYKNGKEDESMAYLEIEKVTGREIIDSRGIRRLRRRPAWRTEPWQEARRQAAHPPASLRRWNCGTATGGGICGKGVRKAAENVRTVICETLKGMDASDIYAVDRAMIRRTAQKINQNSGRMPSWRFPLPVQGQRRLRLIFRCTVSFGGVNANRLPVPMMNILNGAPMRRIQWMSRSL